MALGSEGVLGEAYGSLDTRRRVKQSVKWNIDKRKRGIQSCINIVLVYRVGEALGGVSTSHWVVSSSYRGVSYREKK